MKSKVNLSFECSEDKCVKKIFLKGLEYSTLASMDSCGSCPSAPQVGHKLSFRTIAHSTTIGFMLPGEINRQACECFVFPTIMLSPPPQKPSPVWAHVRNTKNPSFCSNPQFYVAILNGRCLTRIYIIRNNYNFYNRPNKPEAFQRISPRLFPWVWDIISSEVFTQRKQFSLLLRTRNGWIGARMCIVG